MKFVKEVFPDARITTRCEGFGAVRVQDGSGKTLVQVAQRDLYRKYKWPAKDTILMALRRLKMDM